MKTELFRDLGNEVVGRTILKLVRVLSVLLRHILGISNQHEHVGDVLR
jgi:hypothetical protein